MTITGWVKMTALTDKKRNVFGAIGSDRPLGDGGRPLAEFLITATGQLQYAEYDGGTYEAVSAPYPDDGKWHFIAVTVEAANATLYIDGAVVGTGGAAFGNFATDQAFIGARVASVESPDQLNEGHMVDLRIIPDLLNPQQIQALYLARTIKDPELEVIAGPVAVHGPVRVRVAVWGRCVAHRARATQRARATPDGRTAGKCGPSDTAGPSDTSGAWGPGPPPPPPPLFQCIAAIAEWVKWPSGVRQRPDKSRLPDIGLHFPASVM